MTTNWKENGQKRSEAQFKDDKLNGTSIILYDNGQKEAEINYKDGNENGLATKWYKNGQKDNEITFVNGKPEGLVTIWRENGELISKTIWKNGLPDYEAMSIKAINDDNSLVSGDTQKEKIKPSKSQDSISIGVNWGVSVDEMKSSGIILKLIRTEGRLSFYGTRELPNSPQIASEYVLVFDEEYNLQSIAMLSKKINDDDSSTGTIGKKIFSELKNLLQEKYGATTSEFEDDFTEIDSILSGDKRESFYQCLKSFCQWNAYFTNKSDNSNVALILIGEVKDKARIQLSYNSAKWEQIRDIIGANRKKDENLSYLSYAYSKMGDPHNYFTFYDK